MERDFLIIGGNVAGRGVASSILKKNKNAKITVVRKQPKALVPCGIPYIFGTLNSPDENAVKDKPLVDKGVDLLVENVSDINTSARLVTTTSGKKIKYGKLILATGSVPLVPETIKNLENLKNVFFVHKDLEYLAVMKQYLQNKKNIVIVGGGFIGVELADEISKMGDKNVTILEKGRDCLWQNFDEEFTNKATELLKNEGINIKTSVTIDKLHGEPLVKEVELTNGERINADAIIFSIGARPNTVLAQKAGLQVDKYGAIVVDQYMKATEDIYAIGDCAAKKDFFTGQEISIMLASVAASEAKIAAHNLMKPLKLNNKGTISLVSTHFAGITLGSAGLTEACAKSLGYAVKTTTIDVLDRHPGVLPGVTKQVVKLVFDDSKGIILGGQVMGGITVGEMINLIGTFVQNTLTAHEIVSMQMATHPMITAGPTLYPISNAAEAAIN